MLLPQAVLLYLFARDLICRAATQFSDLPGNALTIFLILLIGLGDLVFCALRQPKLSIKLNVDFVWHAPLAADGVDHFSHLRHGANDDRVVIGSTGKFDPSLIGHQTVRALKLGTSDTEPKQAAVVFSLCKIEDLGLLEAIEQHVECFFGTVAIAVKGFG